MDPQVYDAWYQSPRGAWIGQQEFSVLLKLFLPERGQTLLDVGSGYFSRRFQHIGLDVTDVDPDPQFNTYATNNSRDIEFVQGDATNLSFADNSFDYCGAITSLCFVSEPEKAVAEMLRVSRKGVILGLLNQYSLLYYAKRNSRVYRGARWENSRTAQNWLNNIVISKSQKIKITNKSAV